MHKPCNAMLLATCLGVLCGCERPDDSSGDAAGVTQAARTAVPGSVRVLGRGTDLYRVYDEVGVGQVGLAKTGNVLELQPGTYTVELNNSWKKVQVAPSKETTIDTGTLSVAGTGADVFQVYDTTGKTKLAFKYTNSAIELFAGDYVLKLNESSKSARLDVGENVVVEAASILVSGAGEDRYYVFDESGDHKLEFTSTGKAIEVFPGAYTIVCKEKKHRVVVAAGEQAKVTPD